MSERPSSAMREMDPLIGMTVSGRYRVHTLIGQGGMGKVFRAQQIPLGRAVALKVLEARGVDPEFHRRFFQEAAILAKLQSRHTVSIFDYGRDGDLYFIAMELVGGEPLDRILRNAGPLPVHLALMIAQQICRSLREAHAQGIIHRDLKPANVMLTRSEDGEEFAKVLDFGLAKRVDGGAGPEDTQTDTVPGSPKYMAPEVIRRQAVDGRADMYALGVMLYHMLIGAVPFDHENPMDILVAHLQAPPRSFREMNAAIEIPHLLEDVVMRCLAKTPEERFANMQELYDVLRAVGMNLGLQGDPTWAGTLQSPDLAVSGVSTPANRPTQSLRLSTDEASTPRTSIDRRMTRTARGAIVAGLSGALLILALLAFRAFDGQEQPTAAAALPEAPMANASVTPTAAPIAAAPDQEPETEIPTMVITPEEAAGGGLPSVKLEVSSEPDGAAVLVRGKWLGTTPVSVKWRDAQATLGGQLVLALKLEGYAPMTIKRTVDAEVMEISAMLEPLAQTRPPPPILAPQAESQEENEEEGAADAPVLQIAPAEPESDDTAPANEPSAEEHTQQPLVNPYSRSNR